MAEEEQAATKAAAKKAKKQKAKKQAQPEPAASAAESHHARMPSDDAQPSAAESAQLSMDLSELLSSSGQHQAQSPQAHDIDQQQQQQQQQQQRDGAEGTSVSVSTALGAAATQEQGANDENAQPSSIQQLPESQVAESERIRQLHLHSERCS